MQSIRVTSSFLSRLRKWNQLNQFRWTSTKVTPIKKQSLGCVLSKSFSQKFHKNHRKTPVPESLFLKSCRSEACNFIKKETLAQVFSCEFYEISKNTYLHRTLLVAASTYRNDLRWVHFDDEPRVQEREQMKDKQSYISFFAANNSKWQLGALAQTWQQYSMHGILTIRC